MAWHLQCTDSTCEHEHWASNIVDLIENHRDSEGWFICRCGAQAYIEKVFDLQEPGQVWKPCLRGVVPLGVANATYQPFVFLVSDGPSGEATDVWFSYYKDLRSTGGRLKLGYGPGGPPVLSKEAFLNLLSGLVATRCLSRQEVARALNQAAL